MIIIRFRPFRGAVAIATACFITAGCINRQDEIRHATRRSGEPVEISRNIEVLYSDSAIVKVKMQAPLLERYAGAEPYTELKKGVNLTFYDRNRQVASTLTAGYAISRESEKVMEARNNVVVVNAQGDKLNTEHLVWDEKTRKIHSDEFARITTANEIIYGNGMEANEDFSTYRIKDVKGILKRQRHAEDS